MPHQESGTQINVPVQGIDILPTILETLGQQIPDGLPGNFAGRGDSAMAEVYFARRSSYSPYLDNIHTARPSAWKLTLLSDGTKRLSRPLDDLGEETNLAEVHPEVVARMEERLRTSLPPSAFTDHLLPMPEQSLEESTLERLRSLGCLR